MILGNSTLLTVTAGKGRDSRTGIDNDGLTLRRSPTPQIRVMRPVTLKKFRHGSRVTGSVQLQLTTSAVLMRTVRDEFLGGVSVLRL